MSLNKGIKHGKEHRKEYRGAKAVDKSCRNHGNCEWCKQNRLHKNKKRVPFLEPKFFCATEEECIIPIKHELDNVSKAISEAIAKSINKKILTPQVLDVNIEGIVKK